MSGCFRCRNQMSAIAYLWTIELENNGTGLFREKNESPCYANLGILKRPVWALPRSTRGTCVPNCLINWGLAMMSQSSCPTAPRAKSMHSRCIAPVSARTRMRTSRWWATFPTWPKSANMPSISGLTSGLTSGCGLTLLDCALSRRAPLLFQIEQALHVSFLHGSAS